MSKITMISYHKSKIFNPEIQGALP